MKGCDNGRMRLTLQFAAVVALLGGSTAFAQNVEINLTPEGEDFANSQGFDPDELEMDIEDRINEIYSVDYLRAMADAAAMSTKGIGVDYSNEMKTAGFGFSANLSVAAGDKGFDEIKDSSPVGGVGGSITVWGGVNMGFAGLDRLNLYANYFRWSDNFPLDPYEGVAGDLSLTAQNLGLHGQFQLIKPTEGKKSLAFKWGGLAVTGGVQWANLSAAAGTDPVTRTIEENDVYSLDMRLDGGIDLDLNAFNVPIEISTSFRTLYFLTVYGGTGIDLQLGNASLKTNANATIIANDETGMAMEPTEEIGTGSVVLDDESNPSPARYRIFVGLQANVMWLRLFTHLEYKPARAASLVLGTKMVF